MMMSKLLTMDRSEMTLKALGQERRATRSMKMVSTQIGNGGRYQAKGRGESWDACPFS